MTELNVQENNKKLMTLYDKDIFPNTPDTNNIEWKDRPTGKVVLFNGDGKLALIGNRINTFFLLPGGGIDEGESILDGINRECKEETGCTIKILHPLGVTEDFRLRDKKHFINYGYSARVISCGSKKNTPNELDIGAYIIWVSLAEAIELFKTQEKRVRDGETKFYNTCFNTIRDSFFVQQASNLMKK